MAPEKFGSGPEAAAGRAVTFSSEGAKVPEGCACCRAPAASSKLETSRDGKQSLIVPYCDRCLRHASARMTRNLAAALSSCLVALTLTLALPLAWPRAGLVPFTLIVVVLSALPLAWRAIWPRRAPPGHTARERAAWWLKDGSLGCTHREWASALARSNEGSVRELDESEPRLMPWLPAGVIVALIAGPSGWLLHHPQVRVLNLTGARLILSVDGHELASVESTSSENPAAGLELRIASGERNLSARSLDGTLLSESRVKLESGARHLWAPASTGYCFWLEETRYGRAENEPAKIEALLGPERFWVLPARVDTWFASNPPPAALDQRSTGGILVALRQARCEQAPAAARE